MSDNFNDSIFSFSPLPLENDGNDFTTEQDWEDILARLDNLEDITEYQSIAESVSSSLLNCIRDASVNEEQLQLLQFAMPTSFKLFKQSLQQIELLTKSSTETVISIFNEFLTIAINFLQTLDNLLSKLISWEKIEIMKVESLLKNVTELIYESYKHCKNSETIYGHCFISMKESLATLFRNTGTIQNQYYILLNNVIVFNFEYTDSIFIISEVAQILTKIGEVIMNLDLRTMADHWKGFTRFFQQHGEYLSSHINLSEAIILLSSHISNFLIDTDWQNIDGANCVRLLKVANFILKVMIKLSEIYLDKLTNECHKKVIHLLLQLNRFSTPILQSKNQCVNFIDVIESYLTVGADPLLLVYLREEKFIEIFLKFCETAISDKSLDASIFLLSISIMKKLISHSELRENWLNYKKRNLTKIIFELISNGHVEMNLNVRFTILNQLGGPGKVVSLYEYFLSHVASLALIFNTKQYIELESLLVASLLQTNIWKAIFAIDLWCILARYGSVDLCYQHIKNLMQLLKLLSNDYNRIERVFINVMISRLYSLLTLRQKIELIQEENSNFVIFCAIQLNQVPSQLLPEKIQVLSKKLEDESSKILNSSPEKLISLCSTMVHLASARKELIKSRNLHTVKEATLKLWNCLDFREIKKVTNSKEISIFIPALADLTSEIISDYEPQEITQILQVVEHLNNINEANIKLASLLIIKNLPTKASDKRSSDILRSVVSTTNKLLKDSNITIKQTALEMLDHYVHTVSDNASLLSEFGKDEELREELINFFKKVTFKKSNSTIINYNEYLKMQSKNDFVHTCRNEEIETKLEPIISTIYEPVFKKIKLDEQKENVNNEDVHKVLCLLKSNVDALEILHIKSAFNEEIRNDIKTLLKRINGLL